MTEIKCGWVLPGQVKLKLVKCFNGPASFWPWQNETSQNLSNWGSGRFLDARRFQLVEKCVMERVEVATFMKVCRISRIVLVISYWRWMDGLLGGYNRMVRVSKRDFSKFIHQRIWTCALKHEWKMCDAMGGDWNIYVLSYIVNCLVIPFGGGCASVLLKHGPKNV